MADLTDEQCDEFRRLPGSFNDMVRAIYRAGRESTATPPADAALADIGHNLTQQDIDDISRVLCWLKDGDTPPAAAIDRIVKRNAELRGIVDDLRARAVPAFVPYTDSELRQWYPVMCNACGWRGLSRDCTGGGPLADTGDFNDIACPKCWEDGEGKTVVPREVVVVEPQATAVPVDDVIEKIEEYGGHRENEGGSYATFQKSDARRYRAEADEVLGEIRAMLAASKAGGG